MKGKISKIEKNKKISSDNFVELENRLKELEEGKLRALADYQNLQKRIEKEKEELSYILVASLLNEIIEVKEDLERFYESEKNEGIKLIIDKLNNIINLRGVQEILVKKGQEFDSNIMQAITTIKVENSEQVNKVIDVIQKGYILNAEKIIRPTRVVVGKKD